MRDYGILAIIVLVLASVSVISASTDFFRPEHYLKQNEPYTIMQANEILGMIERGEVVNLSHKIIEGDLNIRPLSLETIHIARQPREIGMGISENKKVVLSQVIVQDCIINGNLDFANALMLGPISINGSNISGYTNFCGAQFDKAVSFSHSRFNESVDFGYSNFNQSVDFQGSRFNKSASFSRSKFNQTANFGQTSFNKSSSFHMSRFNQSANFGSSQFRALIDFYDAEFHGFANFAHSEFGESIFEKSLFKEWADFSYSQFDSSVNFRSARFNENVGFRGSIFDQFADFRGSRFVSSANFLGSTFHGNVLLGWSYIESINFDQTAFSGYTSFEDARINCISLNRSEFDEIFLRWQCIGHLQYDETAYLMMMGNFKNLNFLEDANDCYYDYRNDRRATLPWYYQPVDYALMLFYGYGVKPDRPVLWSLIFMAFFSMLFWWWQGILPVREGEPQEEASRFSLLEAVAFSSMTFLSGGKLVFDPPKYKIAPSRPWRDVQISKALFILERLLGMVLVIMFAIAVGKTIVLGG